MLMQLGGTTSNLRAAFIRHPKQMAELAELFRELGIGGRPGRSRMVLQEQAGFPMLKRKAELLKMARMARARAGAGEVMKLLFPPVAPPEELEQAEAEAQKETQKETVKKVVPWALASAAAGLLYFIL